MFLLILSLVGINLVNGGKWLRKPVNIKDENKRAQLEIRGVPRSCTSFVFCSQAMHDFHNCIASSIG